MLSLVELHGVCISLSLKHVKVPLEIRGEKVVLQSLCWWSPVQPVKWQKVCAGCSVAMWSLVTTSLIPLWKMSSSLSDWGNSSLRIPALGWAYCWSYCWTIRKAYFAFPENRIYQMDDYKLSWLWLQCHICPPLYSHSGQVWLLGLKPAFGAGVFPQTRVVCDSNFEKGGLVSSLQVAFKIRHSPSLDVWMSYFNVITTAKNSKVCKSPYTLNIRARCRTTWGHWV